MAFDVPCNRLLNTRGKRTLLFGILNITPDSFSDGGLYITERNIIERLQEFQRIGIDVIDIGGESTRPGATMVSCEEELRRVIPCIKLAKSLCPSLVISIDTYKASVAEEALKVGAHMVNDVSGLTYDPRMREVVASCDAWCVIMHMRGVPENMHEHAQYLNVVDEVALELKERVDRAHEAGISPQKVFIDPGIGFAKRLLHNLAIIRNLSYIKERVYNLPVLVGPSRKAFLGELLHVPPSERLIGTAASVACSIAYGADAVRVHDTAQMQQVVKVSDAISKYTGVTEENACKKKVTS